MTHGNGEKSTKIEARFRLCEILRFFRHIFCVFFYNPFFFVSRKNEVKKDFLYASEGAQQRKKTKKFYICAAQAHYLVTSMVHTKGATVSELTERDYFLEGKRRCLQKAYLKVLPDPIVASPIPRCVDGLSWQLLLLLLFSVHPPHFSNLLLLLLLLLFPPRFSLEQRHR